VLRLAERTNQPRHWMVVAQQSLLVERDNYRVLSYMKCALALAPNDPVLHARIATHYAKLLEFGRAEEHWGKPPPLPIKPSTFTQAEWSAAVACVQRGKAVDTNNAFFDYLHASFLFAVRRDAEALAAMHAGSRKPRLNDYSADAERAYIETLQAVGVPTMESFYVRHIHGVDLSHLARFHQNARLLAYHAQQHRKQGNSAAADALLSDGMKMGARLRDQGRGYIHVLVGIAIHNVLARAAGSDIRNEMGAETWKSNTLKNLMRAAFNPTRDTMLSGLVHAGVFELALLWCLVWTILMLLFAFLFASPARSAPAQATD
jgi:hypothetical protein